VSGPAHDPGVGDQSVGRRPAGRVGEPLERALDLGLDGGVRGERHGPFADLGGRAGRGLRIPIEDPDLPAGVRDRVRDGSSQTVAGSGDDDGPSHRLAISQVNGSVATARPSRRATDHDRARGGRVDRPTRR
jgi:hypothetical protein